MTLEVSDEIGKSMSDELGGRRLSASTRSMTDGEEKPRSLGKSAPDRPCRTRENLDPLGIPRLTPRA
jgi:hypothetical protein